jgi:hypothetical protein
MASSCAKSGSRSIIANTSLVQNKSQANLYQSAKAHFQPTSITLIFFDSRLYLDLFFCDHSQFSKIFGTATFSVSHSTKITESEKNIEEFLKIRLIIILSYFPCLFSIFLVLVIFCSFFTKTISDISYIFFLKFDTKSGECVE